MSDSREKRQLKKQFQTIKSFYELQQTLNNFFENDTIKKEATKTDLLEYQKKLEKRSQEEQALLKDKWNRGMEQLTQTETAIAKLKGLFQDEELSQVRENVNRKEYEDAYQFMKNLPQTWVLADYEEKFQFVNDFITKKRRRGEKKRSRGKRKTASDCFSRTT